jgi:choline dehydrogenase-like flavoprotein
VRPERLEADVLIIGSGAGGATTAAVLAEAGFDVLVVEEGGWIEQGSVTPFSLEQMDLQYRSGGVTAAIGLPTVAYTEGRCAGGGTEVNSGLYRRPPGEIVDRWIQQYQINDLDPDELDVIADEVEKELSIQIVPGGRWGEPSDRLRRGAASLGWKHDESPRWMTYPEGGTAAQGQRQSMTKTYLPRATNAGARLVTDCRIDRLVMRGGRADSASFHRTVEGHEIAGTIRFRHVFVCGGAIQTPALLQRSRIKGHIGKSLAVHPTVKLAAKFRDELNIPDDVPVHQVKEFAPGLSFGGSASHPGLVALSLLDNWREHSNAVESWKRISVYYAAITSEGRGRVQAVPGLRDPLVTYHLTGRDKALLRSGLARLAYLMLNAGAQEIYPSFRGAPIVRSERDLSLLQSRFAASKASVMTVHLCSTVPLGEDRLRCGADSFGRVHGLSNVYVNDASLLPDAPGVNPQGSVMALAIRNARRFANSESPRG